ncbi:MAG: hypothetical protein LWX56_15205 [Ignavibacteria bacterium]|nr:hypothetical protein [Ignavibacteria bacterium]
MNIRSVRRFLIFCFITLTLAGCSVTTDTPTDNTPTQFEGLWTGTELGTQTTAWSMGSWGNLIEYYNANRSIWYKGTVSMQIKDVSTIDFAVVECYLPSSYSNKTSLGIYAITGDTLRLALAQPGILTRPVEFIPSQTVSVFKYIKTVYKDTGWSSCAGLPSITYGGKVYHTVKIGQQCWLRENLDIGTFIRDTMQQSDSNTVIEKYCYNNDTANCTKYGGLYTWNEAMQGPLLVQVKGICPDGWHIPDYYDIDTLKQLAGWDANALKAIGQGTMFGSGSDKTGFNALLGGLHQKTSNSGVFLQLGTEAWFWISDNHPIDWYYALALHLNYANSDFLVADYTNRTSALSVRCLKNRP